MRELKLLLASMALASIALLPAISSANDELDVTMDIIEDLTDIDDEVSTMRGPGDHGDALSDNEHDRDDSDVTSSEDADEEEDHRFDDIDRGDDFENDEDFDFEDEHSLAEEDNFEHDEGEDVDDDGEHDHDMEDDDGGDDDIG
jgi:hypothetical protein